MAPKSKKGAVNASKKPEDEHDEPLQAIILADAHQTAFSPFSAQTPRVLLPLVGVPIIEYTLQALASAGVEEVYIVCGNHADELDAHINASKWSGENSPFSDVHVVRSSPLGTIGDVMRDMDKRAVMKNDFLVVYGDLVSNIPLDAALAAHQKRKADDKNAIMTLVLKESGTISENRAEAPVFVIDSLKNRCLHYEDMNVDSEEHFVAMELDILAESNRFEVRADLIDCGIDICTPEVLALWSDNFDFQTPRQNFLFQVLKDYELNGKTIHTHIFDSHFASRVSNLKAYDTISKQIISRWTYPLCPDSNLRHNHNFKMSKGYRYQAQNVHLSRTSNIGPKTVVGADTRIGDHSNVSNSVIGGGCVIGKNVKIENSYIWDDVMIKDGAVINGAIIAAGCTVGLNSIIEPGALLGFAVQIAENMTIKGTSRIACVQRILTSDGEDLRNVPTDSSLVGQGGSGAEFIPHDPEDISSTYSQASNLIYKLQNLSFTTESFSDPDDLSDAATGSDDEFDVNSSMRQLPLTHRRASTAESILSNSSDQSTTRASRNAEADFHHEAVAGLTESLQRGDEASNVQLELTSLRMTANQSEHAVRRALVTAFMRHIAAATLDNQKGGLKEGYGKILTATLKPYNSLFMRNVHDHDDDDKSDQTDLLLLFQHDLGRRANGDVLLKHTVLHFVLADVLQAEGVEQWWKSSRSSATEELKSVRLQTEEIVNQLLAESDSEEDDDDSGEEENE